MINNETRRPRDLDADEATLFAEVQRHMAPRRLVGVCPEPGLLMAAQAGILPDADADAILAHLSACSVCQTLVEALTDPEVGTLLPEEARRIDLRVREVTAAPASGSRVLPFRGRARWVGLTALGTAAAATFLFIVTPRGSVDPLALPSVAYPPALSAATRPQVSMLRAERLATSEMGLASVSWRGDAVWRPAGIGLRRRVRGVRLGRLRRGGTPAGGHHGSHVVVRRRVAAARRLAVAARRGRRCDCAAGARDNDTCRTRSRRCRVAPRRGPARSEAGRRGPGRALATVR